MKKELNKIYQPQEHERVISEKWEKSGYFNPDNLPLNSDAPSYTIVLPPPNITAKLHLGHTAMLAIEDLLIRYKRLSGYRTLWLPGTDHAAIATQNVVEKKILQEQGKTRHDLGREKFLEEVWSFLDKTQAEILEQTKRMGASLDWSRLAFTFDDKRKNAVKQMFKDMFDEGVIYQGERLVNWCPRCQSTLADDEVDHKEESAKLYWIKYGPFVLATSRPETKLGDTAVAVHPDDARYKKFVGQELEIEGVLGKFKVVVVADKAVDMEFGSGAIKVTPAHSFVDNEIASRHKLGSKKIIGEDGRMLDNCGKYAGLTTKEARTAVVADLERLNLMDHIDEDYVHNSARCYRCSAIIEPLPSKQWFVAVDKPVARLGGKSLKEKALEVAQTEEIKFVPERFKKRYIDWMENLHDWCISRQIWFGHEIPIWYKDGQVICSLEKPEEFGWEQDKDTLDTWFSSGMWTFSTLGWPDNYLDNKKSGDLAKFHPTQVLETGYEIITLWVSRMVMMSLFALGEIPFSTVYLHGMVLDKDGKKMSKSKGNGIDPLDMIKKFGADAVRLSILMGLTPGNDSRFSEEKIEAKRNFINKLWNIARFILSYVEADNISTYDSEQAPPKGETATDKWILSELEEVISQTTSELEALNFTTAAENLNSFTWDKLADWYLEAAKIEKNKDEILLYILRKILIIWHPFIPFVTESIWQSFNESLLLVEKWPLLNKDEAAGGKLDTNAEEVTQNRNDFLLIQGIVVAIRNARSENKIEPGKKLSALVYGHGKEKTIALHSELIKGLKTGIDSLEIKTEGEVVKGAIVAISGQVEIYLIGAVDAEQEKARLTKERDSLNKVITIQSSKLANKDFIERAPKDIVEKEKEKLEAYQQDVNKINQALKQL